MTSTYDDALFKQLLDKRKVNDTVTAKDVLEVFRVVGWDVILSIKENRPDVSDAELDRKILSEYVAGLAKQYGYTLR